MWKIPGDEWAASVHLALFIALLWEWTAINLPLWVTSKKKVIGRSAQLYCHGLCYWNLANSIYMNNSIIFVKVELKLHSDLRLLWQDLSSIFTLLCNENDNNLWVINQCDGELQRSMNQQQGWSPSWLIIVAAPPWSNLLCSAAWDVNKTLASDRGVYDFHDDNDWTAPGAKCRGSRCARSLRRGEPPKYLNVR